MRAFILLSCAVCLAVARPQYNYGQGISLQHTQFEVVAAAPSAAVANGQLDQSTIEILRQLPSVPTSPSTLLHESHQTLSNGGNGGNGGSAGYSSGAPTLSAAPAPSFSSAPAFSAAPQPAPQFAPAPQFSSAPAPQFSSAQASLPLGPSPADIAPSHLAPQSSSSSSSSASTYSAPSFSSAPAPAAPSFSAAPLQLAPAQQPAPAQPSGLYQTAQFPDPITTIHKHIYVHIPPNEFEEELPAPKVRAEPANNQKHVQILFIKAPAPPTPKPIEFPPLGSNEEKTLVYVLVKKPEQPDEIVPPQTPEPKVNKPDVFFIKYQGEKDQPQGYESAIPSGAIPAGAIQAPALDAIITEPASSSLAAAAPSSEQSFGPSSSSLSSEPSAPSAPGPSAPASEAEPEAVLSATSSSSSAASASSSSSAATPDREYIPSA